MSSNPTAGRRTTLALAGLIAIASATLVLAISGTHEGHAEDGASVLTLDAHAKVPYGAYDNLLQTRNYSGIEPDVVEEKFYAQGVGPVLEVTISGGAGRAELASSTRS